MLKKRLILLFVVLFLLVVPAINSNPGSGCCRWSQNSNVVCFWASSQQDCEQGNGVDLSDNAANVYPGYNYDGFNESISYQTCYEGTDVWCGGQPNIVFLSGYVKDLSDNPISGATVGTGSLVVTTDSLGFYNLTAVSYQTAIDVTVSRDGYNSITEQVFLSDTLPNHHNFTLQSAAVVRGHLKVNVYDTSGRVISNALVTLSDNCGGLSGHTDVRGEVTFSDVYGDVCSVSVSANDFLPQTNNSVRLINGGTVDVIFYMVSTSNPCKVSGIVRTSEGFPLADATVSIGGIITSSDSQGHYVVYVPYGSLNFYAEKEGYLLVDKPDSVVATADSCPLDNKNFVLQEHKEIVNCTVGEQSYKNNGYPDAGCCNINYETGNLPFLNGNFEDCPSDQGYGCYGGGCNEVLVDSDRDGFPDNVDGPDRNLDGKGDCYLEPQRTEPFVSHESWSDGTCNDGIDNDCDGTSWLPGYEPDNPQGNPMMNNGVDLYDDDCNICPLDPCDYDANKWCNETLAKQLYFEGMSVEEARAAAYQSYSLTQSLDFQFYCGNASISEPGVCSADSDCQNLCESAGYRCCQACAVVDGESTAYPEQAYHDSCGLMTPRCCMECASPTNYECCEHEWQCGGQAPVIMSENHVCEPTEIPCPSCIPIPDCVTGQAISSEYNPYPNCICGENEYDTTRQDSGWCCADDNNKAYWSSTPCPNLDTGSMRGVVYDGRFTHRPLEGAKIFTLPGATFSNRVGSYSLNNIPVGTYTVKVSKSGYRHNTTQVTITRNSVLYKDFTLFPGINCDDNPPPSIPLTINPVCGKKELHIEWDNRSCSNIISFYLYRQNMNEQDSPWVLVYSGNDLEFDDINVEWSTLYTYKIVADYLIDDQVIKSPETISDTVNPGNSFCEGKCGYEGCSDDGVTPQQCDSNNQLVSLTPCNEISPNYVCTEQNGKAYCMFSEVCKTDSEGEPFGVFYKEDKCLYDSSLINTNPESRLYNPEGRRYCYYDYSLTSVDSCQSCQAGMSCYDYKSEMACLKDNCGAKGWPPDIDCKWFPSPQYEEFGFGYCYKENYSGTDKCGLCDYTKNEPFTNTNCSPQVCDILGSCYSTDRWNEDFKNYELACAPCDENVMCKDYEDQESCEGINHQQGFSLNFNTTCPFERHTSNDACHLGTCKWVHDENLNVDRCIKDANDDGVSDCWFSDDNCWKDNTPPKTWIVKIPQCEGPFTVHTNCVNMNGDTFKFEYEDKNNISHAFYSLTNNSSFYSPCTFYEYDPQQATLTLPQDYNLNPVTIANNRMLPQGNVMFYYYSVDEYKNTEQVNNITLFIDTIAPSLSVNFKVINQTLTEDRSIIQINLSLSEPATCTDYLVQAYGTDVPELEGDGVPDSAPASLNFSGQFSNLKDGLYMYLVSCTDIYGNTNSTYQYLGFPVVVDRIKGITRQSPDLILSPGNERLNNIFNTSMIDLNVWVSAAWEDKAVCSFYNGTGWTEMLKDYDGFVNGVTEMHYYYRATGYPDGAYSYKVNCTYNSGEKTYMDSSIFVFSVDTHAPQVNFYYYDGLHLNYLNFSRWYNTDNFEYIKINATDSLIGGLPGNAGLDAVYYCLDESEAGTCVDEEDYDVYTGPIMDLNDLGPNSKLCYYAVDKRGNADGPHCLSLNIDDGAPEVVLYEPVNRTAVSLAEGVTLRGSVTDSGIIDKVVVEVSNGSSSYYISNLYYNPETGDFYSGTENNPIEVPLVFMPANYLRAIVYDAAGNIGESNLVVIYKDLVPPEIDAKIYNNDSSEITNNRSFAQYGTPVYFEVVVNDSNWSAYTTQNNTLEAEILSEENAYDKIVEFSTEDNVHFSYLLTPVEISPLNYEEKPGNYKVYYRFTDKFGNEKTFNQTFIIKDTRSINISLEVFDKETGAKVFVLTRNKDYLVKLYPNYPLADIDYFYFDIPGRRWSSISINNLTGNADGTLWNGTFRITKHGAYNNDFEDLVKFHILAYDLNYKEADTVVPDTMPIDTKGPDAPSLFMVSNLTYYNGVYYSPVNTVEFYGYPADCSNGCVAYQKMTLADSPAADSPNTDWQIKWSGLTAQPNQMLSQTYLAQNARAGETNIIIPYDSAFTVGNYVALSNPSNNNKFYEITRIQQFSDFEGVKLNLTLNKPLSYSEEEGSEVDLYYYEVPQGWYGGKFNLNKGDNYVFSYATDEVGNEGAVSEIYHIVFTTDVPHFIATLEFPLNETYTPNNKTDISVVAVGNLDLLPETAYMIVDGFKFTCSTGLICTPKGSYVKMTLPNNALGYDLQQGRHDVQAYIKNIAGVETKIDWHFYVRQNIPLPPMLYTPTGKGNYLYDNRWYDAHNSPEKVLLFNEFEEVNITNVSLYYALKNDTLSNVVTGWSKHDIFDITPPSIHIAFVESPVINHYPEIDVEKMLNMTPLEDCYYWDEFADWYFGGGPEPQNTPLTLGPGDVPKLYNVIMNYSLYSGKIGNEFIIDYDHNEYFVLGNDSENQTVICIDNCSGPPYILSLLINVTSDDFSTLFVFQNNYLTTTMPGVSNNFLLNVKPIYKGKINLTLIACDNFGNCNKSNTLHFNITDSQFDDGFSAPGIQYSNEDFKALLKPRAIVTYNIYTGMSDIDDYSFADDHYLFTVNASKKSMVETGFYKTFLAIDTTPPVVVINSSSLVSDVNYNITGYYNETNIKSLSFSGQLTRPVKLTYLNYSLDIDPALSHKSFTIPLTLLNGDGTKQIVITATDKAGNSFKTVFNVTLDTAPPLLNIFSPDNNFVTNKRYIEVTGSTEKNVRIIVSSQYAPAQTAIANRTELEDGFYLFNFTLPLEEMEVTSGQPNLINITAIDPAGNKVTRLIKVYYDAYPPSVVLNSPYSPDGIVVGDTSLLIYSLFSDGHGSGLDKYATQVKVDGKDVTQNLSLNSPTRIEYHYDVDGITSPKDVKVEEVVRDKAGNQLTNNWSFTINLDVPAMPKFNISGQHIHNYEYYTSNNRPNVWVKFKEPVIITDEIDNAGLSYLDLIDTDFLYRPASYLSEGKYFAQFKARKTSIKDAPEGGPYIFTFYVDLTEPDILTIDEPVTATSNNEVMVEGECHDNFGIDYIEVEVENSGFKKKVDCTNGRYSASMPMVAFNESAGKQRTIKVRAYDYVGHTRQVTRTIEFSNSKPFVYIESSVNRTKNGYVPVIIHTDFNTSYLRIYVNNNLVDTINGFSGVDLSRNIELLTEGTSKVWVMACTSLNVCAKSNMLSFLYDITSPALKWSRPMNDDVLPNLTSIKFNLQEARFGSGINLDSVVITLKNSYGEIIPFTKSSSGDNYDITYTVTPATKLDEGRYTLTISAKDQMDNYLFTSFSFSINYKVPVINFTLPQPQPSYPLYYMTQTSLSIGGDVKSTHEIASVVLEDEHNKFFEALSQNEFLAEYTLMDESIITAVATDINNAEARSSIKLIYEALPLVQFTRVDGSGNTAVIYRPEDNSWVVNNSEVYIYAWYSGSGLKNISLWHNGRPIRADVLNTNTIFAQATLLEGRNTFKLRVMNSHGDYAEDNLTVYLDTYLSVPKLYNHTTPVNYSLVNFMGESDLLTNVTLYANYQKAGSTTIPMTARKIKAYYYTFTPSYIVVNTGTPVIIKNQESTPLSLSNASGVLAYLDHNDEYEAVFDNPGSYLLQAYYNARHSSNQLLIKVVPQTNFAFNLVNMLNFAYYKEPYQYYLFVTADDGVNRKSSNMINLFVDLESPHFAKMYPSGSIVYGASAFVGRLWDNYALNLSSLSVKFDNDVYTLQSPNLHLKQLSENNFSLNLSFESVFASGTHYITLFVKDMADNVLNKTYKIVVDESVPSYPTLYLDRYATNYTNNPIPRITLYFEEETDLMSIDLDQGSVELEPIDLPESHHFSYRPLSQLDEGMHMIHLVAKKKDGAGKTVEYDIPFVVDITPPHLTFINMTVSFTLIYDTSFITGHATAGNRLRAMEVPLKTNDRYIHISGGCSDNMGVAVIQVTGDLTSDVFMQCENGMFDGYVVLSRGDGQKNVTVMVFDRAGNVFEKSYLITLDTSAPEFSIYVTPDPAGVGNLIIDYTVGEDITDKHVYYEDHEITDQCNELSVHEFECIMPITPVQLGYKKIRVNATDNFGNSAEQSQTVFVDTVSPEVYDLRPLLSTNRLRPFIGFSYADDLDVDVIMYLDNLNLSSPSIQGTLVKGQSRVYFVPGFDLNEGHHTVRARITDEVGNTKNISWSFDLNTGFPDEPNISVEHALFYRGKWYLNKTASSVIITLHSEDTLADVLFKEADHTTSIYSSCNSISMNQFSCAIAGEDNATGEIIVKLTRSGITASYSSSLVIDTTPPQLEVDSVPGFVARPDIELTGRYTDQNMKHILFRGNLSDGVEEMNSVIKTPTPKPFRHTIHLVPINGQKQVEVVAEDRAGNSKRIHLSINYNDTPPYLMLDEIPALVNYSNLTVSGRAEPGTIVQLHSDSGQLLSYEVPTQLPSYTLSITPSNKFSEHQLDVLKGGQLMLTNNGVLTYDVKISAASYSLAPGESIQLDTNTAGTINLELSLPDTGLLDTATVQIQDLADKFSFTNVLLVPGQNLITVTSSKGDLTNTIVKKVIYDNEVPLIQVISPGDGDLLGNDNLNISAELYDKYGIDDTSIILIVDGVEKQPTYNPVTSIITYNASALTEGEHTVYVRVMDKAGNLNEHSWKFKIDYSVPSTRPKVTFSYERDNLVPIVKPTMYIEFDEPVKDVVIEEIFDRHGAITFNHGSARKVGSNKYEFELTNPLSSKEEDNYHTVILHARKDIVGDNPAARWTDIYLNIDKNKPDVAITAINNIFNIINVSVNKANVTVLGTYHDQGIDRIEITGDVNYSMPYRVVLDNYAEYSANFYLANPNGLNRITLIAYDKLYDVCGSTGNTVCSAEDHWNSVTATIYLDMTSLGEPVVIIK